MGKAEAATVRAARALVRKRLKAVHVERDTSPRTGTVAISGFHGRTAHAVEIVGYTPTKVRIRAVADMPLPGRGRRLLKGEIALIPKHAVEIDRG